MKKNDLPIYVTQPSLPPLEEFMPYLEGIWRNKLLTNGGPYHQELEKSLVDYLGVGQVSLFNNGTNALITAIQALELTGEVITTPYSFVATAHSLVWNNLKPIFVDIDGETFNIDPTKIEEAITPKTTAILAVHCYGNPCDVEAIDLIAKKHKLKVVYDAAHAFGVKFKGRSILSYGDISILSFHATKVFNTFEGGAVIVNDVLFKKKIDQLKNFGLTVDQDVEYFGTNGKMSEICSAFGLCQLKYLSANIEKRRFVAGLYNDFFNQYEDIRVLKFSDQVDPNFSYYPVIVSRKSNVTRDEIHEALKSENVYSRKYFFPLIPDFSAYKTIISSNLEIPTAREIADQVLCLPMSSEYDQNQASKVLSIFKKILN